VTPTTGNANRAKKSRALNRSGKDRGTPSSISLVRDEALVDDGIVESIVVGTFLSRSLKRSVDILGATIGILLVLPVLAVVAIAIKIESRGPIFFAHKRLGRGGALFDCWKFRSMHQNAESLLHADEGLRHHYVSNHFKIPHHLDPRITRLGRFLRRSSIDELPQLWNVLCGDMSLVGPRPIVSLEATHYGEDLPLLLSVRPGLTGAWAVQGRSRVGYPHRASIELDYVRQWKLASDLGILLRTPTVVLTQRGVV